MLVIRVENPREEREKERMVAQIAKQEALLDYVAIMAGVDIPVPEESEAANYEI